MPLGFANFLVQHPNSAVSCHCCRMYHILVGELVCLVSNPLITVVVLMEEGEWPLLLWILKKLPQNLIILKSIADVGSAHISEGYSTSVE